MNHLVYLSIGSNLGAKVQNCQNGIAALEKEEGIRIVTRSPFYKTQPVDFKDQDWFVNAALKIETSHEPEPLLSILKSIEKAFGREKAKIRFGPRILDLDLIFYDDLVFNSPELTIPHPRMHKRCFVLKPLCDIDSGIIHPILKLSLSDLLDRVTDDDQKVLRYN